MDLLPNVRQATRVHYFDRVRVFVEDRRVEAFGLDVSEAGMRLRSNEAMPRGARLSLEFSTSQGEVRVEEAEVVWAQPFKALHIQGRYPGFGVRFLNIDSTTRQTLSSFLAEATPIRTQGYREPTAQPDAPVFFGETTTVKPTPVGGSAVTPAPEPPAEAPEVIASPSVTAPTAPEDADLPSAEANPGVVDPPPSAASKAEVEPTEIEAVESDAADQAVVAALSTAEAPEEAVVSDSDIVLEEPEAELPSVVVTAFEPGLEIVVVEPEMQVLLAVHTPRLSWRRIRTAVGAAAVAGLLGLLVATRSADASGGVQVGSEVSKEAPVELAPPAVEQATVGPTEVVAPPASEERAVANPHAEDLEEAPTSPVEDEANDSISSRKSPVQAVTPTGPPEPGVAGPPKTGPQRHAAGTIDVRPEKDGWVLVVWHRDGLRTRAFGLSSPARYVVDVFDSDAPQAPSIDPHVVGVHEIRTNPRDGFVRYVVDFTSAKVPDATVFRDPHAVSVRFR